MGSSPLTRGKPGREPPQRPRTRLIPAHAGKTFFFEALCQIQCGSSPLTRGKPAAANDASAPVGLIPAHAGKTERRSRGPRPPAAHPRSRGENDVGGDPAPRLLGSSPLTRGKLHAVSGELRRDGLIPAHAGKTRGSAEPYSHQQAHPRSRGENSSTLSTSPPGFGSSPLTRGKPGVRPHCRRR